MQTGAMTAKPQRWRHTSDSLLSLVLHIVVKRGVRLEDTEEVLKCQGVRIGDHLLSESLHQGGGIEGEVLKHREEED